MKTIFATVSIVMVPVKIASPWLINAKIVPTTEAIRAALTTTLRSHAIDQKEAVELLLTLVAFRL
ncbi:MAG: hypothetical protein ABJL99_26455 [Aliishimia sp.]